MTGAENHALDSHSSSNATAAGAVESSGPLTTGRYYAAQVTGVVSMYIPTLMAIPPGGTYEPVPNHKITMCGTPESGPTYPSAGVPSAKAGQDAEVVFARPWEAPCPHAVPAPTTAFQISTDGSTWQHVTANGGPFSTPSSGHSYVYLLKGGGSPARFRVRDLNYTDDNGSYAITLRPATGSDCAGNAECLASGPSTSALTTTAVPTASLAPAPRSTSSASIQAPSTRSCLSRRRFRVRIVSHRADPVVRAVVRLNGKKLKTRVVRRHGIKRFTAIVDLRRRTKATAKLVITGRTRHGRKISGVRVYHTCTVKRRGRTPRV